MMLGKRSVSDQQHIYIKWSVLMRHSSMRGGNVIMCLHNQRRLPGGGVEGGIQLCP